MNLQVIIADLYQNILCTQFKKILDTNDTLNAVLLNKKLIQDIGKHVEILNIFKTTNREKMIFQLILFAEQLQQDLYEMNQIVLEKNITVREYLESPEFNTKLANCLPWQQELYKNYLIDADKTDPFFKTLFMENKIKSLGFLFDDACEIIHNIKRERSHARIYMARLYEKISLIEIILADVITAATFSDNMYNQIDQMDYKYTLLKKFKPSWLDAKSGAERRWLDQLYAC